MRKYGKSWGDFSLDNLRAAIKEQQLKTPIERNYQLFFSCCSVYCDSIASNYYLRDTENRQSIYYTYLSGRSAILERLFASLYAKKERFLMLKRAWKNLIITFFRR